MRSVLKEMTRFGKRYTVLFEDTGETFDFDTMGNMDDYIIACDKVINPAIKQGRPITIISEQSRKGA